MGLGKTIQVTAYFAQLLEWCIEDHADGGVDDMLKRAVHAVEEDSTARVAAIASSIQHAAGFPPSVSSGMQLSAGYVSRVLARGGAGGRPCATAHSPRPLRRHSSPRLPDVQRRAHHPGGCGCCVQLPGAHREDAGAAGA